MNRKTVHLLLNQYVHDTRVKKETESLAEMGHEVTVLALHRAGLPLAEKQGQVSVRRLQLITRDWQFPGAQLFKYCEYFLRALPSCLRAEVIHCHDFDPLPMAVLAKIVSLFRLKIIYDSHEFQSEVSGFEAGVKKEIFKKAEVLLLWLCDGFITVSSSIAEAYKQRSGVTATLIFNCPRWQKDLASTAHETHSLPVFLYQGLFFKNRGVEELLQTFAQLSGRAQLVLIGKGELEPLIQEFASRHKNISCLGFIEPKDLLRHTQTADFGVIATLRNCLNHEYCLPNKFFEYAAAGVPVLSVGVVELKKLIEKYHCGHTFEQVSVDSILKGVDEALALDIEPLRRGSLQLIQEINWQTQEPKLRQVYESLS